MKSDYHSSRPKILPSQFISAAECGAIYEDHRQFRLPFGEWDHYHNRNVEGVA